MPFKFNIDEKVRISENRENGVVIARAEYATYSNQYYLRSVNNSPCLTERWLEEHLLESIEQQ